MTTAQQYADRGSRQVLAGGMWVRLAGGVMHWQETLEPSSPGARDASGRLDVHQLRACTVCPARVDEWCTQTNGDRAKQPHAGRLAPRLCACGQIPQETSSRCDGCAALTLSTSKARAVRNAIERERAA